MSSRVLVLLLSFVATVVIAVAVVAHFAAPGHHGACAYGSGKTRNSCKPRPEPSLAEFAAAIDGSALAAGVAALRATEPAPPRVAGMGLNRWGETSFTVLTGETAPSGPITRFARFDRAGQPLPENRQAQYEDVPAHHPFPLQAADPRVLREALGRADRAERFVAARLETAFAAQPAIAWRLTYASRGQADPQGAMYAMAADGQGLCRLDSNSTTPGVVACNFMRLPSTPMKGAAVGAAPTANAPAMLAPASPALTAKQDPALKKSFDQMACVKKAQGDVAALRRCVEPAPP